ncbi:MAG: hypothetical protein A2166_03310 [Omnitrophica WOR_2 bacterium RBG_13_41_10]|nr:MAG: hypothetical protein A2166_03310 [Omnitrophica WOR_2 bacterium RBG_13_41_10]
MPKKSIKEIIAVLVRVLKAHHAPHEIALGVAIGSFIAILPLYGFHTVLCVIAAILIPRANKLAILLGTNVSLPPTVVTITWTAYDIGRLLLADKNYPPLSREYIRNFKISRAGEFYYPLFIGSVVLGLLCAAVFYLITLAIAKHFKKKASS